MYNFTALPPLSLYIHIPWCLRKCPYCDFNSHEVRENLPEKDYVAALISDLENDVARVWGRAVESIFIGGGTPSLFSPEALDQLLSHIRAVIMLNPHAEITLEANPGTVEQQRFAEFKALGINRLSIGIQSFDNRYLQALGRVHDQKQAIAAAETAHAVGFDNFNLDLMFGLPQQTVEDAIKDVTTAIALSPAHISYYQLTIEPNTLFHHQPPSLPDDDIRITMQQHGHKLLSDNDYGQYEISAFAKPDRQCWHNINYWRFGDYLGIGAGAHAKISDAQQQCITRLHKTKHPNAYLNTNQRIAGETRLSRQDTAFEFMMNALRQCEGFPTALFTEHTGLPISIIVPQLKKAEELELITWDIQQIRPTERGQRYLNDLLMLFLPDDRSR